MSDVPLIAVTGPYGLVGRGLLAIAPEAVPVARGDRPEDAPGRPDVNAPPADVTDAASLRRAMGAVKAAAGKRPMVLVHLAALTDTKSGDSPAFDLVNVRGTMNALEAASAVGAGFIHVSTDYVFSGEERGGPFREADRPRTAPSGAYAASKFRAENLVLDARSPRAAVCRVAFPYGGLGPRAGLAEKLRRRFEDAKRDGSAVRLFMDQAICPSYIPDVARGLLDVARFLSQREGPLDCPVFHLVGEPTTPLEFGLLVRDVFGREDVPVEEASVRGSPYAGDLRLSSQKTRETLGWRPTAHKSALIELRRRLKTGGEGGA